MSTQSIKPATKRRIFWVVTVLASILCLEGISRLALSWDWFFQRVALNDDAIWRHRWIQRHRGQPKLSYEFDVHHPVRGWASKPNVHDTEIYEGKVLSTNSRGLRGSREYTYEKPDGVIRIVVIGDSFTFGHEVADDETFSHYLAEMLPGIEVLNLGVHGYGHGQMLLYLKEEGVKYDPDVVLLGYIDQDVERNILGFRDFAKPRYELVSGELRLTGVPVASPEETLRREPFRSKLLDLFSIFRTRFLWQSGRTAKYQDELTLAILDEIAETTRSIGATPAFAHLPTYHAIDKPDLNMTRSEQWFFQYCRRRGIQSMYLRHQFLPKLQAGAEFKTWGHWGPLEHLTAAESMKAYLVDKGVIEWPPPGRVGSGRAELALVSGAPAGVVARPGANR